MQFLQQIQSISSQTKWISEHPKRKHFAAGALLLVEVISLIAGNIFSLIVTTVLFIGMALHLQNRWITRLVAAALTVIIIAISATALFPAYATAALATGGVIAGCSFAFCLWKVIKKE